MKIGTCYLCKRENINLTKEHIFPQCLGGRLKSKIYCKECNNKTGEEIDIELANNFGKYATLMNIKRERGKNQTFIIQDDINNLELKYYNGYFRRTRPYIGKPIFDLEGNIKTIDCNAGTEIEARNIMKGKCKQYNLDENKIIYELIEMPNPSEHADLMLGNNKIYRAIAKIAYSFACMKLPQDIILLQPFDKIRKFILNKNETRLVSLNYVNTNFLKDDQKPLNKIHLSFNPYEKTIIGYVTIFNAFRYTILIGENVFFNLTYPQIDYNYELDPLTGKASELSTIQAPIISKRNIINPNQTEEQISNALKRGMDIICKNSNGNLREVIVENRLK